jgi:hypothetical protein
VPPGFDLLDDDFGLEMLITGMSDFALEPGPRHEFSVELDTEPFPEFRGIRERLPDSRAPCPQEYGFLDTIGIHSDLTADFRRQPRGQTNKMAAMPAMSPANDLDALFALPLSEFTAARNVLVKRLKQEKRADEAARVQALAKPSIAAWAVNQLYWKHRNEFDRLLAAGARLSQAHAAQLSGKATDVKGPLAARREAASDLLRLAEKLLGDAGHSATPDTLRRIAMTLETLAVPGAPVAGRLTEDVAPLGFESLAAIVPVASKTKQPGPSANAALRMAEQQLEAARTAAEDAAESLAKAKAVAREAERRVQASTVEAERAAKALQDAEQRVEMLKRNL